MYNQIYSVFSHFYQWSDPQKLEAVQSLCLTAAKWLPCPKSIAVFAFRCETVFISIASTFLSRSPTAIFHSSCVGWWLPGCFRQWKLGRWLRRSSSCAKISYSSLSCSLWHCRRLFSVRAQYPGTSKGAMGSSGPSQPSRNRRGGTWHVRRHLHIHFSLIFFVSGSAYVHLVVATWLSQFYYRSAGHVISFNVKRSMPNFMDILFSILLQ